MSIFAARIHQIKVKYNVLENRLGRIVRLCILAACSWWWHTFFFFKFLLPVANNFRVILFLWDFEEEKDILFPLHCSIFPQTLVPGRDPGQDGWLSQAWVAGQSNCLHPYSQGQRMCTDHRCKSWSFIHVPLLGRGGIISLPPPWGSLRLCRFAFACLFWISLPAFCILSLAVSVLPPPFSAHWWDLHFCDTVHHVPSSSISSLLFSGSSRLTPPSVLSPKVVGAKVPRVLFLSISEPLGQWEDGEEGPYSFQSSFKRARMMFQERSHNCVSLSSPIDLWLVDISAMFWHSVAWIQILEWSAIFIFFCIFIHLTTWWEGGMGGSSQMLTDVRIWLSYSYSPVSLFWNVTQVHSLWQMRTPDYICMEKKGSWVKSATFPLLSIYFRLWSKSV